MALLGGNSTPGRSEHVRNMFGTCSEHVRNTMFGTWNLWNHVRGQLRIQVLNKRWQHPFSTPSKDFQPQAYL